MTKKFLTVLFLISTILPSFSFEDYIVFSDKKLSDISIKDNTVVDIYPLVTINNKKDILFIQPLKEGETKFCVLKNGKDIVMFDISITKNKTSISCPEGFEVLSMDIPEESFELDKPPVKTPEKIKERSF